MTADCCAGGKGVDGADGAEMTLATGAFRAGVGRKKEGAGGATRADATNCGGGLFAIGGATVAAFENDPAVEIVEITAVGGRTLPSDDAGFGKLTAAGVGTAFRAGAGSCGAKTLPA